jgi:hypothetical protein
MAGYPQDYLFVVNPGEPLLNVVNENKPKRLKRSKRIGLGQKARGQVQVFLTHLTQMMHPRRRGGT